VFTRGEGRPLVLVPGVQGRWEWMRPAVDALSRWFTVVTFSLAGERDTGLPLPAEGRFDEHVDQVERVMDGLGLQHAVVCGVSYGGLVAVRTAAVRPDRVEKLVLSSTPAPTWRPDARLRRYAATPWMSAPAFVLGAPGRLWKEIGAAQPGLLRRSRALSGYFGSVCRYPASPARMAGRVRAVSGHDFLADARAVRAPTLVISGEPHLDRVVSVRGTREYLEVIPGAIGRTIERTGHIGLVTRPEEFARHIKDFAG
jgi:pimeloyl-ACP methyl ester carboxylesterase